MNCWRAATGSPRHSRKRVDANRPTERVTARQTDSQRERERERERES